MNSRSLLGLRIAVPFALLAVMFLAQPLRGQNTRNDPGRWEAFAQFGGSFFTSVSGRITLDFVAPVPGTFQLKETQRFAKTGRLFTGIRFNLSPKNQLELSYSYSPGRLVFTFSGAPLPSPGSSVPERLFSEYFQFTYVRRLPGRGRFRPFVAGGFGSVLFVGAFERQVKAAGNFGAGFDLKINKHLSFRYEQRTFVTRAPERPLISTGGSEVGVKGTTFNIVPSAGLVWRF